MSKKVILSIIGGALLLCICGVGITAAVAWPTFKKAYDEKKSELEGKTSPTPSKSATTTPTGGSNSTTPTVSNSNFKTYTNSELAFELKYPRDWVEAHDVEKVDVAFKSPKESASDSYQEMVSVITEDISGKNISLDKYTELSLQNLGDIDVIDEADVTINGQPFYSIVYISKTSGGQDLKVRQAWTVTSNTAYVLTYGAPVDSFSRFDTDAIAIFNSFKLK